MRQVQLLYFPVAANASRDMCAVSVNSRVTVVCEWDHGSRCCTLHAAAFPLARPVSFAETRVALHLRWRVILENTRLANEGSALDRGTFAHHMSSGPDHRTLCDSDSLGGWRVRLHALPLPDGQYFNSRLR